MCYLTSGDSGSKIDLFCFAQTLADVDRLKRNCIIKKLLCQLALAHKSRNGLWELSMSQFFLLITLKTDQTFFCQDNI